jgi:ABC-2 type transport system permease protein
MSDFAGTWSLVRFALRRDRLLLPAWILVFAGIGFMSASATVGLYPQESQRVAAAETINASTALVALYGPVYDPTSVGEISLFKMTAFGAALAAVLMVFVVIRHTRGEEEAGRLELMAAGRVGRQAPLAAALIVAAGGSVLLALMSAGALIAAGLAIPGSFAFGLGWGFTGLAFAAVAAVCAQITTGARAARGLALIVVAVSYAIRAVGDVSEGTWLTWLSPLGWMQQIRAYAGDRWWVLLLPLALAAVCVPVALVLRNRRDLGAGLITDRPGPAHGRMGSAQSLAWRLQRPVLIAWVVAFAVFGALLGSLSDIATGFLDSEQAAEFLRQLGGAEALVDAFLGTELSFMGIIAAGYGISAASRLHSEEVDGRAEVLLAEPLGRLRWASSHIAVAAAGIVAVLLAGGVGLGVGSALALGDVSRAGSLVAAALARVPAAWVLAGLVVLFFGWLPRWVPVVWGVFVVALVLGELGPLWDAPQWLMNISPFVHSPRLPAPDASLAALLPLTLVALALLVIGLLGWRRRDVAT